MSVADRDPERAVSAFPVTEEKLTAVAREFGFVIADQMLQRALDHLYRRGTAQIVPGRPPLAITSKRTIDDVAIAWALTLVARAALIRSARRRRMSGA